MAWARTRVNESMNIVKNFILAQVKDDVIRAKEELIQTQNERIAQLIALNGEKEACLTEAHTKAEIAQAEVKRLQSKLALMQRRYHSSNTGVRTPSSSITPAPAQLFGSENSSSESLVQSSLKKTETVSSHLSTGL